jgi:hypothetical protein
MGSALQISSSSLRRHWIAHTQGLFVHVHDDNDDDDDDSDHGASSNLQLI